MSKSIPTVTKEKLLSFLRQGDYAHPGEEQAIEMCFSPLGKNKTKKILDVGCGLGGTAAYIEQNQYGTITGVDISESVITYAKQKYPQIQFYCADAAQISELLVPLKFDLICLFNSFFYFTEQKKVLENLRNLAEASTKLIIFEYTDLTRGKKIVSLKGNESIAFSPIKPETITDLLRGTGWKVYQYNTIDKDYEKWYDILCQKIKDNKQEIIEKFSLEAYEWAEDIYFDLLNSIKKKEIGGCILVATITN